MPAGQRVAGRLSESPPCPYPVIRPSVPAKLPVIHTAGGRLRGGSASGWFAHSLLLAGNVAPGGRAAGKCFSPIPLSTSWRMRCSQPRRIDGISFGSHSRFWSALNHHFLKGRALPLQHGLLPGVQTWSYLDPIRRCSTLNPPFLKLREGGLTAGETEAVLRGNARRLIQSL